MCVDRKRGIIFDEKAIIEKFGVPPESIPDYLALVGDSADGFPGLKGWGASSTAAMLSAYQHIEAIPSYAKDWSVKLREADRLAQTLLAGRDEALLYRRLGTLVVDVPDLGEIDDLLWAGPRGDFQAQCRVINTPNAVARVARLLEHI